MKKFFYLAAVAVTALFSACSDSSIVPEQGKDWTDCFDADGHAYLKFAVTTPTSGSTRADGYDNKGDEYGNYADGTETDVKKAYLAIYGQKYAHDAEEAFTCLKVYDLGEMTWNEASEIWISKKAKDQVVEIDENTAVGNVGLWALVVLNNEGWTLPVAGQTFGAWRSATSTGVTGLASDFTSTKFYMTNMPYTNGTGATANTVKALYPVKLDKIYKTRDDAVAGENTTVVNVERGVAKVEVTDGAVTKELKDQSYTFGEWFVDNYNTVAFNIRHCALHTSQYTGNTNYGYLNYAGQTNTHRFVFPTAITEGAYRTAWAVDPNYNVDAASQLTKTTLAAAKTVALGAGNYAYFHENTFDVGHQTEPNTTRVIIPAVFNDGYGFYTLASDPDVVYTADDAKAKVYELLNANPAVQEWIAAGHLASTVSLDKIIKVALTTVAGEATVTVTPVDALPTGVESASGHTWADCAAEFNALNVADYIAAHETFTYYADGKAYYRVLIQHFGAHDTPWQANAETMTNNTPALIYGYTAGNEKVAEQKYLGRYGAVRNNWYKINVTGVSKIGSATIPTITGNTDDTVEAAYIKYTINMVPWVIRTQNVTLH